MVKRITVLGAGLAGLSAAINLAKADYDVIVFEKLSSVGMQIHPNYQALRRDLIGDDVEKWFSSMGLNPVGYKSHHISKIFLQTPHSKVRDISFTDSVPFVLRGGKDSLEWALYKEAKESGVRFEFNTKQTTADIIASGHKRCDMAAYGEVYEAPDFPEDHFFYMHDDRYSPKGGYSYIVPMGDGLIEVINCVFQSHVPKLREYYSRLVRENSFINQYVKGKKPLSAFGGYGGMNYPPTAKKASVLLVGEAAGFQDVCRGFGMSYAIESGMLAAKSILENKDYDKLWRDCFGESMKNDYAKRFIVSLFGDRSLEFSFRKLKDKQIVDRSNSSVNSTGYGLGNELLFRMELLKRKITRYW